MTEMSDVDLLEPELVGLCQELSTLWQSRQELTPGQRGREMSMGKFVVVHGLVAHTYSVAALALPMIEAGHSIESLPLVRLCYECALKAHWIAQNIDGAEAFVNADLMSRKAAIATLRRAQSAVLREGAEQLEHLEAIDLHATSSKVQARNFAQMCEDLTPGGADAYLYYRILSWYCHPTSHIADRHVDYDFTMGRINRLRRQPGSEEASTWLFFLACSLVWAGRAVDFLDRNHSHRNELRAAARRLGIAADLQMTPEARRRIEQAAQAARHAARIGKRERPRS